MTKLKSIALFIVIILAGFMAQSQSENWPALKTYKGEQLTEVAMPLGGIGTGTVSIGGRAICATGK